MYFTNWVPWVTEFIFSLFYYWQLFEIKLSYYWLNTGAVLARYSLEVLVKLRNRDIIDSWHSTGFLRAQYWLLLLAKNRQRKCSNLRDSTGLVLAYTESKYWLSTDIWISLTVGTLLTCYCRCSDYYYWSIYVHFYLLYHFPNFKNRIHTLDEVPINTRPYLFTPSQGEKVERVIHKIKTARAIQNSKSPYNSRLLIMPKKIDVTEKKKWRIKIYFWLPEFTTSPVPKPYT